MNKINYIKKYLRIHKPDCKMLIQKTKTPTNAATATDPATAKRFETAPFAAGPGASAGGEEIDEGGFAGASEEAGVGDGGELSVGAAE